MNAANHTGEFTTRIALLDAAGFVELRSRILGNIRHEDRGHGSKCWIWQAREDGRGYGVTCVRDGNVKVHRLTYEMFVAPIPQGLMIDHLCRVPLCVNPQHLEPVTAKENSIRYCATLRNRTHCKNNHPLTGDNVFVSESGIRGCWTCRKVRRARSKLKSRLKFQDGRRQLGEAYRAEVSPCPSGDEGAFTIIRGGVPLLEGQAFAKDQAEAICGALNEAMMIGFRKKVFA